MKPDTSQDMWWTWLQTTRGPKHEVVKLWGPKQKMWKFACQVSLSKPWENIIKDPQEVRHKFKEAREATWRKVGPNRAENGPRLVSLAQFGLGSHLLTVNNCIKVHLWLASVQVSRHSQGTLLPSSGEPKVSNPWNKCVTQNLIY
jgi:hypothetical protein